MVEGGGMTTTTPPQPVKRRMGWRVWVAIVVVVIVVIAGVAYYLTSSGGPKRDTSTITYYMQSEPLTFDSADAYDLWSFIAIQNTYDTLVGYTGDSLALSPNLATSWDVLDGQHYVFHLRQGVKFADGSNFTASDVYWSFYRVLKVAAPTVHDSNEPDDPVFRISADARHGRTFGDHERGVDQSARRLGVPWRHRARSG